MSAGNVWFSSKHIIVPYLTLHSHTTVQICISIITISYVNMHLTKSVTYLVFFCTFYTVHLSNEGLTQKLAVLTAGDNIQVSIQAAHNLIIIDSVTPTSIPLSSNIVYC